MVITGLDAEIFVQHCKCTAKGRYEVLLTFKELTAADETTPSHSLVYTYVVIVIIICG
jgi:hypothetical protein